MKTRILLLLVYMLAGYSTQAQQTALIPAFGTDEAEIEVIYPQEVKPLHAKKLGEFKIKKAHYLACDIDFLVSMAKFEAEEKGGNAIYLTNLKPPARGKNCYTIEGEIYKLDEPYKSKPNPFSELEVYISAEDGTTQVLPLFPGGIDEMVPFIYRKFNYPNSALRDKVGGKIELEFKVSENGKISEVQVKEGIRWDLDQEALRVITLMPEWVPGYQNGETVPVIYTLSVKLYPWLTR